MQSLVDVSPQACCNPPPTLWGTGSFGRGESSYRANQSTITRVELDGDDVSSDVVSGDKVTNRGTATRRT